MQVQVQMQVAIHVIQGKTGGAEFFELRMELDAQLLTQTSLEKIAKACAGWIVGKFSGSVDQPRDFRTRQSGVAAEEGQVQAYSKTWILARKCHGFTAGGLIYHQARAG